MGGWRKMYFILQNQLLLSYSSKDDYEKKLAPFKDIINLVPGTVIIPTTGPRFTIETNSKVLYTFVSIFSRFGNLEFNLHLPYLHLVFLLVLFILPAL